MFQAFVGCFEHIIKCFCIEYNMKVLTAILHFTTAVKILQPQPLACLEKGIFHQILDAWHWIVHVFDFQIGLPDQLNENI